MRANQGVLLAVAFQAIVVTVSASETRASYLEGEALTVTGASPTVEDIFYEFGPLIVGDGPELIVENLAGVVDFVLDISDTSILFRFPESSRFNTGTFNGYIIQADVGSIDPFRMVTVNPSTTLAGFDESRILFEDYKIFINVSSLVPHAGNTIRIDVSAVPEPVTGLLLLLGSGLCIRSKRFQANDA